MMDKFKQTFREEAFELLESLEANLITLETSKDDEDALGAAFRAMHTIKGSSAMFGFSHVSEFTHHIENLLDLVRKKELVVEHPLVTFLLECRDHIRALLELDGDVPPEMLANSSGLIKQVQTRVEETKNANASKDEIPAKSPVGIPGALGSSETVGCVELGHSVIYRITFKPGRNSLKNGTALIPLFRELNRVGNLTVRNFREGIPLLSALEPDDNWMTWEFFLTSNCAAADVQNIFSFVQDSSEVGITIIDDLESQDGEQYKKLGQILIEKGIIDAETVERAAKTQRRLGEVLSEVGLSREAIQAAIDEQDHVRRERQKIATEHGSQSIRVNSEKLDNLVDMVGEIVTLQARFAQYSLIYNDLQFNSLVEQFERLTSELRNNTMAMRMVPLGAALSKYRRLVRDLSTSLGKDADLIIEGGETELDKSIIEKLNDPILHILRNAMDHGIESSAQRKAAGKPGNGVITITACHSGASVMITVTDDGRGIDGAKVAEIARQKGLLRPDQQITREQELELLFMPGFSTADSISQVSGRGVGMEVVKKEIERLGGRVKIESILGAGTQIEMSIPLTLAIIEGLLIYVAGNYYIVPLTVVEECIEFHQNTGNEMSGMVRNRGDLLPFIDLMTFFGLDGEASSGRQAIVVNAQTGKIALVVDTIIGSYQTVIKNLGKMYSRTEGISGATIMGDGTVALILDVNRIATTIGSAAKVG